MIILIYLLWYLVNLKFYWIFFWLGVGSGHIHTSHTTPIFHCLRGFFVGYMCDNYIYYSMLNCLVQNSFFLNHIKAGYFHFWFTAIISFLFFKVIDFYNKKLEPMKEGTLGVEEMQEFIRQTAIQFPTEKLKVKEKKTLFFPHYYPEVLRNQTNHALIIISFCKVRYRH